MSPTRSLFAALALVLCAACATTVPMNAESRRSLSGASLAPQAGRTAAFVAVHPFVAMFGAAGHIRMMSTGRSVIDDNGVADPAVELATALANDLAERHGVHRVGADAAADFALRVRTTDWRYIHYNSPDAPLRYRLWYDAKAELIDLRTGDLVARGSCSARPGEQATAPTRDEMLADGAAWLKAEIGDAAAICLDELRASAFLPKEVSAQGPI